MTSIPGYVPAIGERDLDKIIRGVRNLYEQIQVGTAANQLVALDANAKLPAVDGSQLTNIGGAAVVLRGYLAGLTLSNDGTSPNTVLDIAAGMCTSDDASTLMSIAAFTKNCNAAWAVGSGNGALDSGSALAASTWYHAFIIERTDTGVVDVLLSTSATAPTLPTSYTKQRRIGSIRTNASSQIIAFSQEGDEFLWKTAVADAASVVAADTLAHLLTLTVPPGVKVTATMAALVSGNGTVDSRILFTSPDENDQNPGASPFPVNSGASSTTNNQTGADAKVRTNTSAQIRYRWLTAGILLLNTRGWVDTRGRFA